MVSEAIKKFWSFRPGKPVFPVTGQEKINLGCGGVHHPAWANFDLQPVPPEVLGLDLRRPLPFPANSFQAVYCSHVLEHLPRGDVPRFLRECARILRPGGVLRLVVPDLEAVVREYLRSLEGAIQGDPEAEEQHEWMTLELLDQLVRRTFGGYMARWWRARPLRAAGLICRRLGEEAQRWIERFEEEAKAGGELLAASDVYNLPDPPPQKQMEYLRRGEAHRWMYDRVSLARLLQQAGLRDIQVCRADTSRIERFADYRLDTDELGKVRKPDSLFMEAVS